MRRRRFAAAGAAVVIIASVASACGAAGPTAQVAPATVPTRRAPVGAGRPAPTHAPAVEGSRVEELQRVVDAIDAAWGRMIRALVEAGRPTAETQAYLESIYAGDLLARMEAHLGRDVANGLRDVAPSPGDPHTVVHRVIADRVDCVELVVTRSYDGVRTWSQPPEANPVDLALRRTAAASPAAPNPTGWSIVRETRYVEGVQPRPCG